MEVKNKKQMIEYLNKGISGDIYKRFECYSTHFRPFEKNYTEEEKVVLDFVKDDNKKDYETIEVSKQDLFSLLESNISTVFNGYRFYFEDYKKLEEFCKIVETD